MDGDAETTTVAGPRVMALGEVLVRAYTRRLTPVLLGTAVAAVGISAIALPAAGAWLSPALGTTVTIWLLAAVSVGLILVASLIAVALPSMLMPERDRTAAAVHAWVGAREVRRALGGASRASSLPTDRAAAERWLAEAPSTDALRPVRFEILLMAGRHAEARAEAEHLPHATPLDRYRRLEAVAMVDAEVRAPLDVEALRAAAAAVSDPVGRAEASGSLAIVLARQALPEGDWRAPLVEARPLIPGSTRGILLRDHVLPIWTLVVRRSVGPIALLIAALAALLTSGLGR